MVVGVGGGHQVDAGRHRQLGQPVVAYRVGGQAVIPQLGHHVGATEVGDQTVELASGCGRTLVHQGVGHRPLAAGGEYRPVVAGAGPAELDEPLVGDTRRPFLPCQLPLADGPSQLGVPPRIARQHEQVLPGRIGTPHTHAVVRQVPWRREQRQLCAEHRGEADGAGSLGEANHSVEAVVVGEGQGLEPEPGRLLGQLLGVGGPVEEREVGVTVELGVGHAPPPALEWWRFVARPFARPGRAVAAVAFPQVGGATRGRTVGQPALDLAPGHLGVVEAHVPTVCEHVFALKSSAKSAR